MSSNSENIQKLVLETLEKNQIIPDSRFLLLDGEKIDSQSLLGVLKRLIVHEVKEISSIN